MISAVVKITEINNVRENTWAQFIWNPYKSVDTVLIGLPGGVIWNIDFEMLMFGGDCGGDAAVIVDDDAVIVGLFATTPNSNNAEIVFDKDDVNRFVADCVRETERYGYVLTVMRGAEVDRCIERIFA